MWYASIVGGGCGGLIPFEYIPASYVSSYFNNFGGNNVAGAYGVIGGPAYGFQHPSAMTTCLLGGWYAVPLHLVGMIA